MSLLQVCPAVPRVQDEIRTCARMLPIQVTLTPASQRVIDPSSGGNMRHILIIKTVSPTRPASFVNDKLDMRSMDNIVALAYKSNVMILVRVSPLVIHELTIASLYD